MIKYLGLAIAICMTSVSLAGDHELAYVTVSITPDLDVAPAITPTPQGESGPRPIAFASVSDLIPETPQKTVTATYSQPAQTIYSSYGACQPATVSYGASYGAPTACGFSGGYSSGPSCGASYGVSGACSSGYSGGYSAGACGQGYSQGYSSGSYSAGACSTGYGNRREARQSSRRGGLLNRLFGRGGC